MLSRLRRLLLHSAVRLSSRATGRYPADTHNPDDIFLIGFPRSGHTWCQYLLAGLTCGLDTSRCPDSLVQEIVPDLDSVLSYGRHTRPMFLKTHAMPSPSHRRVIYLLRDGRDAMASYFHYYNDRVGKTDYLALVRDIPGLNARWHEHVDAWTSNPHNADLLLVKYEDLLRDPCGELQRIADFSGLGSSNAAVATAVGNAGFDKLQQREQILGWADQSWPKDKPFVRRGVIGSFRDEMPAEALEMFLREALPTLARHGYPI